MSLSIVRPLVFAAICATTAGCGLIPGFGRTPMTGADVEQLTTCKNSDLAKIKKNLVLAGYSIRSATDDVIETDFKQVAGHGTSKVSERISVVKVDDTTAKFRVRVRQEGVEKVETGRVQTTSGVVATDSKLVETQNDEDEKYYVEGKPQYEETRRGVCGA